MNAEFWNERYQSDTYVYGTEPNRFVRQQVDQLPADGAVLALGAGEGRNAVFLAEQGFDVTALDYAAEGLRKLQALAAERGVSIDTIQADVTTWTPERLWDGVVATFLHVPPDARPRLYRTMRTALRPGGVLLAEWFRPEQVTGGYQSGGPPTAAMMVTEDELRAHFPIDGIQLLRVVETHLDEGPHHSGPAAVVQFVWQRPAS
ncbi:MAG: methyltransferase domain-containing protein [Bacteroidetes bacterium]|jgi:SAM-dependent methyltransferase|nr:methyltransferase domain-containing protein [Bacteroidota bacterium]